MRREVPAVFADCLLVKLEWTSVRGSGLFDIGKTQQYKNHKPI